MPRSKNVENITKQDADEQKTAASIMEALPDNAGAGETAVVPATEGQDASQPHTCETIEEARQAGPTEIHDRDILDDKRLERGGLIAVKAFIRSDASTNALRQKRKRERQAAAGAKALQIQVPSDQLSREAAKSIGKAMMEGRLTAYVASWIGAQSHATLEALVSQPAETQISEAGSVN